MKPTTSLLYSAWKKLIWAYLICFVSSVIVGSLLVTVFHLQPENLYQASTKRLSCALPVLDIGVRMGVDLGVLLFLWNSMAALLTISFLYTASWFDPRGAGKTLGLIGKICSGKARMKLLCYLPGCARIDAESIRRVYVWLMVPMLGMILLGIESGFTVSTGAYLLGSIVPAFVSLVPHGVIEIPMLAMAGAAPFSAHLLLRRMSSGKKVPDVFQQIVGHRNSLPVKMVFCIVIGGLLVAGWVEAHVTTRIVSFFL